MKVNLFGFFSTSLEYLIIIFLLLCLVWGNTVRSCSRVGLLEGFEIAKKAVKQGAKEGFEVLNSHDMNPEYSPVGEVEKHTDISSWGMNPVVYDVTSKTESGNSIDMFKNTKFSYSCCPNMFSNSSGCACMSNKK
jgi:hypothetical protein